MINILQAQKLGFKKIKFAKGKSLFIIIPIGLMVGLIVLGSSEAQNLIKVAHDSVFSPIQGQNEVLELNESANFSPRQAMDNTEESGFTQSDIEAISTIGNIEKASLLTELPVEEIKSSDLFEGKVVNISSVSGLDKEYSKLYTNESFQYVDGSIIPIILNANDFQEIYEDWQGQTSIEITMTRGQDQTEMENSVAKSPIKVRAVSYDREDLIGKEITIEFGGLATLSDYKQESSSNGFTYTLKTEEELNSENEARRTSISQYWDYEKISTPLTYKFVIVGISEGADKTKTFVPLEFVQKLMQDYLSYEITARNVTEIPESERNSTYIGLTYDGVNLENDSTSALFASMRKDMRSQVEEQYTEINEQIEEQNEAIGEANQRNRESMEKFAEEMNQQNGEEGGPGGPGGGPRTQIDLPNMISIGGVDTLNAGGISIGYPTSSTVFTIPGLVYLKDRSTNDITGEYTSFDFTQSLPIASNSMLIKLNDITNREQVVSDLNSNGYSYQDYSQYKELDKLEKYLNIGVNAASIVFMVITALFILINMAKFVSEGRKEIGIFRAIGASKNDIRLLFILQSLAYTIISIISGALLGILGVYAISNLIVNSAQKFINSTIGKTLVLSGGIQKADFLSFDSRMLLMYAGAILLITLIVSLVPSGQAAKVSPVEAIRN